MTRTPPGPDRDGPFPWSPERIRHPSDLAAVLRDIRDRSGLGYKRFEIKGRLVVEAGAVPVSSPEIAANPLPKSSLHRAVETELLGWFAATPERLAVFLRVAGCPAAELGGWLAKLAELVPPGAAAVAATDLAADLDRLKLGIVVDHERLFGVDGELAGLGRLLANRSGDRVISIVGDAGVGKTALAYELVMGHAEAAGFGRVAAVSAKFSHLGPAGRLDRAGALLERVAIDWRDLLMDIARQLRLPVDLRPDSIAEQLPAAMPRQPCLILIDNLETLPEARFAVHYLTTSGLLVPHKVVLTTRAAVADAGPGVRERRWTGPDRDAARAYAGYLAGDDPTLDPSPADLDDVVDAAERVPLLIKIIIGQAIFRRLPVREVVTRLRQRGGALGSAVWAFCYADSLDALAARAGDEAAERLMSVFCAKAPGSAFAIGELRALSGIGDPDRFEEALAVACQLSLVRAQAGNTRFTVHSLLREFYCGGVDGGGADGGG